jgi:hypothetical protein
MCGASFWACVAAPPRFGVGGLILDLAGATSAELGNEEHRGCTDRGVDDRTGSSSTKMDTRLRKQPVSSKSADSFNYYVTNPAARATNPKIFRRQVHCNPLTGNLGNSHKGRPSQTTIVVIPFYSGVSLVVKPGAAERA